MELAAVLGLCLASVMAAKLLEGANREIKLILTAGACVLLFMKLIAPINTVAAQIRGLISGAGIDLGYAPVLFKGLGICYLTELVAGICRDSGENALAAQAELAGKLGLVLISLPLLSAVTEVVRELLI